MIFDIRHRTTYIYHGQVPFGRCLLRLTPSDRPGQTVSDTALDISPAPSARHESIDFFGNRVIRITLSAPHDRLQLTARATVEVRDRGDLDPKRSAGVEAIRAEAMASRDLGADGAPHGLFPSRFCPINDAATTYAARSLPAGRPILEGVEELSRRIKADFLYDPEATDIATPIARTLKTRRGVCQDFAHVMIAGLRGLGLSARYVSGYLRTVPPPGKPRLEGADAMHAWVEVWAGAGLGWVGYDPTNGIRVGEDHVVVAVGRDYGDVSPIDGVVRTAGGHDMKVAVDVIARASGPVAPPPLEPAAQALRMQMQQQIGGS